MALASSAAKRKEHSIREQAKRDLREARVTPQPSEVVGVHTDAVLYVDNKKQAWTVPVYWSTYEKRTVCGEPRQGFVV